MAGCTNCQSGTVTDHPFCKDCWAEIWADVAQTDAEYEQWLADRPLWDKALRVVYRQINHAKAIARRRR